MRTRGFRRLAMTAAAAVLSLSLAPARATVIFEEHLGNFPDAIAVTAEFGTFTNLSINSTTISATGFLFHLANTSYGDGMHSSFANDPDGDFATSDVLTPEAAAFIDSRQPFGIYLFGATLPTGSGAIASAPSGFVKNVENTPVAGNVEVNFKINLMSTQSGLIFDPAADAAIGIPGAFPSPRLGTYDFFISIPINPNTGLLYTIQEILDLQDPLPSNADQGIDMSTRMAWLPEPGDAPLGSTMDPEFPAPIYESLRPRGQVGAAAVSEPASLALFLAALLLIPLARRRTR